jgi:two-component system phosphate regulon sensor histidine kinase PhoR
MTKRIFKSIFIVAVVIFLASVALIMGVLYEYYANQYSMQLKNESTYIIQGMTDSGVVYLENIENKLNDSTRITWIDEDGTVLYDNFADPVTMENHSDRKEVQEALTSGEGESIRYSKTIAEKTIYYAVRLSDGTVLRISSTKHSAFSLVFEMLKPLILILVIAVIFSALLARRSAKRLVQSLNEIDLEHPEETETYEELTPMLHRIVNQKRQIQSQIAELKRRQQEFITIIENMSEGLLVVDNKTDIISYNSSAMKLLGASKVSEKQSVLTLNRSESFRKAVDKALSGSHSEQPMQLDEKYYELIANPVFDGDVVAGAVIVILDVTEKEEREKLRREFTANVSHELKTPLTSISGFAEIIKNKIARPEDIERFANNIYEESQRLMALIGDIIKLSQLDENIMQDEMEYLDLFDIVNEVVQRLKTQAEKKNITIELNIDHAPVKGVRQILEEMIYNLCDNAIKYNKNGGKVIVALDKNERGILLSIKDTGIGIAPKEQERVFERFYRVDKSHSKEISGTGLGLSIVKHAALFHNAEVTLESELNKGTTVNIQF